MPRTPGKPDCGHKKTAQESGGLSALRWDRCPVQLLSTRIGEGRGECKGLGVLHVKLWDRLTWLRDVQGLSPLAGMQRKRNPEQPDPQGKPLNPALLGRCPKPQGIYTRMIGQGSFTCKTIPTTNYSPRMNNHGNPTPWNSHQRSPIWLLLQLTHPHSCTGWH